MKKKVMERFIGKMVINTKVILHKIKEMDLESISIQMETFTKENIKMVKGLDRVFLLTQTETDMKENF